MRTRINKEYRQNQITDIRNILNCIIKQEIYLDVKKCDISFSLSKEPIDISQVKTLHFKKINEGEVWGEELFDCAWFNVTCDLNDLQENKNDLYVYFDINGEALLYDDKTPIKGFTNGSSVFDRNLGEPGKQYYPIKHLIKNGKIDLLFDCGYNDLFGNIQENGIIKACRIVRKNYQAEEIYYDIEVLLNYLENSSNKQYCEKIYESLLIVRDLYWYNVSDKYIKAKNILSKLLNIKSSCDFNVTCVGHSHLDLAWLWPIRESKRKIIRTITNMFYLLEKDKDFHFVISQPQQLIWIQENEPKLFSIFKKYEAEGRIELVGGAFVEMDTNVTGEEQLVRQMLYGQKYYLENFSHYVNNLWLPDTFGYSGNLPQIIKKSKMDFFVTTKISWNTVNQFPYHNFIWKGIDGSEVLTHLPPENTYNSPASCKSLMLAKNNTDKAKEALVLYGIGNGAGGPGEEHLERIKREKDLLDLPKINQKSVDEFYKKLNKKYNEYNTYVGELYLENHQGTYTSQSENKRYNRLLEEKLKRLEWFLQTNKKYEYQNQIDDLYKRSLLLEFHDILPGSSIKRVYIESIIEYKKINNEIDNIFQKVLNSYQKEFNKENYLLNHLNYDVELYKKHDGNYYKYNIKPNESTKYSKELKMIKQIKTNIIETDYLKISFSKEGYINKIINKTLNKDILIGCGNKLRVFIDHGDAWNIRDNYRNQDEVLMNLTERKVSEYSDLFEISSTYIFKESKVLETMIVYKHQRIIEFHHDVDWKNVGYMLRSNFNVNVKSNEAVCDIQFGNIKRSRKNNTSIEKAQFEVCAQQYIDFSDSNYGVSLINKTKCGYYIKNNDLELNLLRSTSYPCVNGDVGKTTYSYMFYIHEGDYIKGKVDKIAYIFNSDFIQSQEKINIKPAFIFDNENIEFSCFKGKYKDTGSILRLYERNGKEETLNLKIRENQTAYLVNMLEEEIEMIKDLKLSFKPFEVKTILIK